MKTIQLNMASGHFFYSTADIRQGENLASQLQITLSDDFKGYDYAMVFKLNALTPILVSPLTPVNDVITVDITNALTEQSGVLQAELQAFDTVTGLLAKSASARMKVRPSILGTGEIMPEDYVPWVMVINQAAVTATTQAGLAEASAVEAARQAGLAEDHATTAGESETEATRQAGIAATQAGIASGHATTASQQAGIASGHATTASQQAGIAAGHAITATTKAGEANTSAIAAAGSASTATAKAQLASDKAAEAVETLAGTVKKTQKVNGTALSGDITVAASAVPVTPSGGISATNVQGAIEELDGEKAGKLMATNLFTNGDYSTPGTGIVDGMLKIDNSGSSFGAHYRNVNIILNHLYYGSTFYNTTSAPAPTTMFVFSIESVSNRNYPKAMFNVMDTGTGYKSGIYKATTDTGIVRVGFKWQPVTTLTSEIDYTLLIDLTETFGAGNEPSKEQMDEILKQFPNSWFDGTKEILPISQVGKMLMVQPPWIAPTLVNSFANFGGTDSVAGYMKDSIGFVHLAGKIKTGASGASPWTLPVGYRPQYNIVVPITSNDVFGYCTISTGGIIMVYGNATYYSLSGITFKAV